MMAAMLGNLSVWSILIGTLTLVLGSIWLGNIFGRHQASGAITTDAPINAVTGAHLGLLSFFLAFSFNMASGHYDERRKLVLEEANVISTAYFAAELLPDVARSESIRSLLRDYVDLRAALSSKSNIKEAIATSEAILARIDEIFLSLAKEPSAPMALGYLARSINEVSNYHNRRVAAAFHYRIPDSIWPILYAVLTFSMIGLGYSFGLKGSRNHLASLALALSFSVVIYLTVDLDRPNSGLIVIDQGAEKHLAAQLAGRARHAER